MNDQTISTLISAISPRDYVTVLTGAGVSAESGVATFRNKDNGLWSQFDPQKLARFESFLENPELVWKWYNFRKETIYSVQPNPGHVALVEMESLFSDFYLITQNIDNLHKRAGNNSIIELHGNIEHNYCISCQQPKNDIVNLPPTCDVCGGLVRPDVVWFGEMLNQEVLRSAFFHSEQSTIFLVIGTSAQVYPAANLPVVAAQHGAKVIVVNPEPTPIDAIAHVVVREPSGEWLPEFARRIKQQWEK